MLWSPLHQDGDDHVFYGGSLMDVSSKTAWRNCPLSSACLPASTVETPIHSPMSCVHLLLGLPLPLLLSHVPSKNSFSNVLRRLMWPKYDSFCFLIRFKSCGAFTPSFSTIYCTTVGFCRPRRLQGFSTSTLRNCSALWPLIFHLPTRGIRPALLVYNVILPYEQAGSRVLLFSCSKI